MTLGEWLKMARMRVSSLEAQVLAGHVLLKDRAWVLAHPEVGVPELALELLLQRLEAGEPLAYVTGRREFYGLEFEVSPAVLIPRQETETLVEAALELASWVSVLDIGTGSGCIAVALKHARPGLRVTAVDVSVDALEMAKRNAERHGAEIEFVLGDGVALLAERRFDLVVSNPPYVAHGDSLGPGVGEFEPHLALFSGPTGLEFYERLAAAGPRRLLVEVGDNQAAAVQRVFESRGFKFDGGRFDLLGIERVLGFSLDC